MFMHYLGIEHSMEILLSVIEIMQFQKFLKRANKKIIFNDSPDHIKVNLDVPWIPISAILETERDEHHDKKQDCKAKAHQLFKKYISDDAARCKLIFRVPCAWQWRMFWKMWMHCSQMMMK